MAANALDVEPVADVEPPSRPVDCVGGHTQASTVYQLQLAFMAARLSSLEEELERERAKRQRIRDRYEQLLADRDEEIRALRRERRDGFLSNFLE